MSFWKNDKEYKVRLVDFVERFIAHNTCVKLFTLKLVKDKQGIRVNEYNLIWKGMDWQITEGYVDSDYFRAHPDVLPCPYGEVNVIGFTSAGISGEFTDDASLVVEIKE